MIDKIGIINKKNNLSVPVQGTLLSREFFCYRVRKSSDLDRDEKYVYLDLPKGPRELRCPLL